MDPYERGKKSIKLKISNWNPHNIWFIERNIRNWKPAKWRDTIQLCKNFKEYLLLLLPALKNNSDNLQSKAINLNFQLLCHFVRAGNWSEVTGVFFQRLSSREGESSGY